MKVIQLGKHQIRIETHIDVGNAQTGDKVVYTASVQIITERIPVEKVFSQESIAKNNAARETLPAFHYLYYTSDYSAVDAINGLTAVMNANTALINLNKANQ